MKKTLLFQTTHAGATTLASALTSEDGDVKNVGSWTAPKKMGITKIHVVGVAQNFALINRNSHARSPMTLNGGVDAATLNYNVPGYDFIQMIGAGVIVDSNETVTVVTTATGAGVVKVLIELDDQCPTVDFRAVRVAGSAALVVNTPTSTGGNVAAGVSPNAKYVGAFCNVFAAATTNCGFVKFRDGGSISLGVPQAAAIAAVPKWFTRDQMKFLTGTGTEHLNLLQLFLVDTVATAAATIVINFGWIVDGAPTGQSYGMG